MNHKLRSILTAAATLVAINTVSPVYASLVDVINLDNGQFVIDESNGTYTVHNNSSDQYIYAFAVTNPNGLTDNPQTTFANWSPYSINLKINGPTAVPVNAYVTADANISDWDNVFLATFNLANYIAPGTSSSLFTFDPTILASDAGLLTVDAEGNESQFNTSATPLPAALPLFGAGLGMIGLIARRRRRKNAAALAAA